jgi:hypothetical protein
MAYVGNTTRYSSVSRRSGIQRGDINLWAGRIAASASFVFIAVMIFGL